MTETADLTGDDDWLSAAEALRRVEAVMGEFKAKLAIAARAHDGLVRTRADRFIKHGETFDDVELPNAFWWAEGHEALEQNWVAGDFSTWINETWHWKAYGVQFHRDEIAKLIPPIVEVQVPGHNAPTDGPEATPDVRNAPMSAIHSYLRRTRKRTFPEHNGDRSDPRGTSDPREARPQPPTLRPLPVETVRERAASDRNHTVTLSRPT